jgi:hypothetical protein
VLRNVGPDRGAFISINVSYFHAHKIRAVMRVGKVRRQHSGDHVTASHAGWRTAQVHACCFGRFTSRIRGLPLSKGAQMDRQTVILQGSKCDGARAWRRLYPLTILSALLLLIGGLATADEQLTKSGTVSIEQVQIAWIGSANLGGGSLQLNGQTYKFTIGGLGVGGFGISKLTATGEVYNLNNIAYFPGAYVQGRWGFALGDMSNGELWIRNDSGVYLHLKAERQGLALSLGGDAIYVNMD